MKINDILAKMLRKEELTEAERKFLETYREPKPDTSKLTELQQQLDQLRAANGCRTNFPGRKRSLRPRRRSATPSGRRKMRLNSTIRSGRWPPNTSSATGNT